MTKTVYLFVIFISLLLSACDKDDPVNPTNPSFKGDFVSAAHTTSGVASINQAKTTLALFTWLQVPQT